ncbi:serine hydrolase domain-containing protein [Caulobacter sp. RL271]|jgi:CubicO group peptidase (beta-lactamase class C family)|uniref:Serine hydrolase n=1 Tax=Caulobacter segnis TaxID=88688 RepID=A0ABY4ZZK2_9CAUL|nr:serine hydrolase domain-containing protein [Caulobacter segnis]USQ97976.1 serine hydrolase [Caulobacter segnis]
MNTTWLGLCLTTALLASTSAHAQTPEVEQRIQAVTSGLRPAVTIKGQASTRALADEMKALRVPGVSIAVIKAGKVEWARGFGVTREGGAAVTADTLFQAGSVSKPVAAAAALRLAQEGKLALDADVNASLKSWKLPASPFTASTPMTLRALLSHTAGTTVHGFAGYAAGQPVPTLPQVLSGAPPANSKPVVVDQPVGQAYRYSGGGYSIAQQMMVDVTGQAFPTVVRRTVFAPLGMDHSTEDQPLDAARLAKVAWPHDAAGAPIPGGPHTYPEMAAAGLWTTPGDLARFVIAIQRSAKGQAGGVLSPEMTRTMLTPVKGDYGLGFNITASGGETAFSHDGSNAGYKATLVGYVQSGDGVVVMTNGDQGYQLGEEIVRAVAAVYGWPDHKPVEREVAAVPIADQTRYAGVFSLDGQGDFTIRRDGERLVADIWKGVVDPLYPASDRAFFITSQDLRIVFASPEDPDHGTLSLGGFSATFKRKAE